MKYQKLAKLKQMAMKSQYGVQKCKRTAKKGQETIQKLPKISINYKNFQRIVKINRL